MDAIFPALIGIGLWFMYEAWTNPTPHPVAKVTTTLSNLSGPTPGQTGYGVVAPGHTVNAAGVAQ